MDQACSEFYCLYIPQGVLVCKLVDFGNGVVIQVPLLNGQEIDF